MASSQFPLFEFVLSQAMMTVRRMLRGPGTSLIGKPSIHPVAVDLKGKPYE